MWGGFTSSQSSHCEDLTWNGPNSQRLNPREWVNHRTPETHMVAETDFISPSYRPQSQPREILVVIPLKLHIR